MTAEELASYESVTVGPKTAGVYCFLCRGDFEPGERALMVPSDCEETAKKDAGGPYNGLLAHVDCVRRVP